MHLGPPDLRQESEDFFVAHTLDSALHALHQQVLLELHYTTAYPASLRPGSYRASVAGVLQHTR